MNRLSSRFSYPDKTISDVDKFHFIEKASPRVLYAKFTSLINVHHLRNNNAKVYIPVELGDLLEQEVSVTWPDGIVKVIRTSQRKGVAGARMVGIERAEGDIILTLDAHIEVFTGW
jgi:glycosyltransferase involved in cell wall biosynthesis